jgi:hypothetical protein
MAVRTLMVRCLREVGWRGPFIFWLCTPSIQQSIAWLVGSAQGHQPLEQGPRQLPYTPHRLLTLISPYLRRWSLHGTTNATYI